MLPGRKYASAMTFMPTRLAIAKRNTATPSKSPSFGRDLAPQPVSWNAEVVKFVSTNVLT